jgi:hypothetical protein
VVVRSLEDSDDVPIPDRENMDQLMAFAIRTRIRYSQLPLKADAMLCTLFQGNSVRAVGVIILDDYATDIEEMTARWWLLLIRFGWDYTVFSECLMYGPVRNNASRSSWYASMPPGIYWEQEETDIIRRDGYLHAMKRKGNPPLVR